MTVKRNGEKVILKGGRVSCSCCGFCRYFDIDVLLYEAGFSNHDNNPNWTYPTINLPNTGEYWPDEYPALTMTAIDVYDFDSIDDPPAAGAGWTRHRGCWRFLCRDVTVVDGTITSETNKEIGGPTTTSKNLWEDLMRPTYGNETESGTYIYSIEFYAWRFHRMGFPRLPTIFQPSDTYWSSNKWKITKQT